MTQRPFLDSGMPSPRLSAPDLLRADLPERRSILDPILDSNSLALLYGPHGLGKTFVALGIAWAAASGGSFLGWKASRPHRVLYVDGEMAAADVRQRLRLLGSAPPTLEFMLSDLNDGSAPDLGYGTGQIKLMEAWGRPELVVLDNLASLAGIKSGNPDCWNDLQRFLVMQRRFGRAVLMVHHANKSGLQRGTNRREDVLDLVMALRPPADYSPVDGARFEIHFEKARGLHGDAVRPIEARFDTDAAGVAQWQWRPAGGDALERAAALLNSGLGAPAVALELGVSRATAYRLRERARREGLLDL
jgi:AAA domain